MAAALFGIGAIIFIIAILKMAVTLAVSIIILFGGSVLLAILIYLVLLCFLPKGFEAISIPISIILGFLCFFICLSLSETVTDRPEKPESIPSVVNSMIGTTYNVSTDDAGTTVVFSGQKYSRICIKIIDENTMSYTFGMYLFTSKKDQTGKWEDEWIAENVGNPETCDYKISYNYITGKTILKFEVGGWKWKYQVRLDDGVVKGLSFYKKY